MEWSVTNGDRDRTQPNVHQFFIRKSNVLVSQLLPNFSLRPKYRSPYPSSSSFSSTFRQTAAESDCHKMLRKQSKCVPISIDKRGNIGSGPLRVDEMSSASIGPRVAFSHRIEYITNYYAIQRLLDASFVDIFSALQPRKRSSFSH